MKKKKPGNQATYPYELSLVERSVELLIDQEFRMVHAYTCNY
jgi:hypothetical protein